MLRMLELGAVVVGPAPFGAARRVADDVERAALALGARGQRIGGDDLRAIEQRHELGQLVATTAGTTMP